MLARDVEHLFGASIRERTPSRIGRHVSKCLHDEEDRLRVARRQFRGRLLHSVVASLRCVAAESERLHREELR
jgi:hypothetical protein